MLGSFDQVLGVVYEELLQDWDDVLILQRGLTLAAQGSRAEKDQFSPVKD